MAIVTGDSLRYRYGSACQRLRSICGIRGDLPTIAKAGSASAVGEGSTSTGLPRRESRLNDSRPPMPGLPCGPPGEGGGAPPVSIRSPPRRHRACIGAPSHGHGAAARQRALSRRLAGRSSMAFDLGKFVGMAAPTASLPHRDPRGRNTTLSILYADGPEGAARGFRRAHRPGRRAAGRPGWAHVGASLSSFHAVPGAVPSACSDRMRAPVWKGGRQQWN